MPGQWWHSEIWVGGSCLSAMFMGSKRFLSVSPKMLALIQRWARNGCPGGLEVAREKVTNFYTHSIPISPWYWNPNWSISLCRHSFFSNIIEQARAHAHTHTYGGGDGEGALTAQRIGDTFFWSQIWATVAQKHRLGWPQIPCPTVVIVDELYILTEQNFKHIGRNIT